MVLWDSATFRDGIWTDILKGHYSSIKYLFEAKIKTRINDYKTNKHFDAYNSDWSQWVFVHEGWRTKHLQEEWLENEDIKYDNHWMTSSNDTYYYFYNQEDAVYFKLTWV